MKSIFDLYNNKSRLYEKIANDRDFKQEVDYLVELCKFGNNKINTFELFAGPAYHSIVLQNKGYNSYVIDFAESMKLLAVNNGLKADNYIIAKIPECFKNEIFNLKFDLFLMLRFSCGYLNSIDLYNTIKSCKNLANKNAILFIEVHKVSNIINDFSGLSIKERIVDVVDSKISCYWPSGNLIIDDYSYKVKMPVKILENSKEYNFISEEVIHSSEIIKFMASLLNIKCEIISDKYFFTESILLKLIL